MRLQLSLELLIYLSISATVFIFIVATITNWQKIYSETISKYETYTLVSYINSEIYSGASVSNITVTLPKGSCNFSINGNKLITPYGTFYFAEDIIAQNGIFCDSGSALEGIELVNYGINSVELKRAVK